MQRDMHIFSYSKCKTLLVAKNLQIMINDHMFIVIWDLVSSYMNHTDIQKAC